MSRRPPQRDRDNLLGVVVGVVVIVALYFARVILIPVALATLLSFILTPLGRLFERARLGRVLSSLLVVLLAVAAAAGVGWTITRQLATVVQQLPDYQENIADKIETLRGAPTEILGKAQDTVNEVRTRLSTPPGDGALTPTSTTQRTRKPAPPKQPMQVQLVKAPSLPLDSLQSALGFLTGAGLVFVFTLFMIMRREDLRNRFISLVGRGHLHTATQAMDDAAARVSRYLRMQLVVNTGYGVIIGTGLHFIGLPGALFWGVIAGILRFVPYLGPPLGAIGPVLLSVAIFTGWHSALLTLGLYVGTELAVSQFVEPMLYGEHTGLSPVAVLLAAVFWTALWGPLGLVMSTPLTVCLVVLGRRVPRLGFLHTMLGDEPVLSPEAHFYQRLLAMDVSEARDVLETSLKKHSLEDLYESVLIPALSLVEQDRHNNALDDFTEKFVCQNAKELVEEIYESAPQPNAHDAYESAEARAARRFSGIAPPLHVVCVPARDDADEIVGIMLTQVLRRSGYRADCVSLSTTAEMLSEVDRLKPDLVCISALPPFAISHARLLYGKLRSRCPDLKIILGLWSFSGDLRLALNRMGMAEEGTILTTLSQVAQTVALANEFARQKEAEAHSLAGPS